MKYSSFQKIKTIFAILSILLFSLPPIVSFAQTGIVPCGPGTGKECDFCDFFVMIDRVFKFFLVPDAVNAGIPLVPVVAVLMIVIGGFMYVIAYTSSDQGPALISRAKSLFSAVALGLLISYGAWVLVSAFFIAIGVAGWVTQGRAGWWEIKCS